MQAQGRQGIEAASIPCKNVIAVRLTVNGTERRSNSEQDFEIERIYGELASKPFFFSEKSE